MCVINISCSFLHLCRCVLTALLWSRNMCRLLFLTCWQVKLIAWCLISACAFFIYLRPVVCGLQRLRWHPVPARWACRPGGRPGGLCFLWGGCGGFDGHALAQGGPQCTAPSSLSPCGLQPCRDQTSGSPWSHPHWRTHTFGRSGIGCRVCAGMRGCCPTAISPIFDAFMYFI